MSFRSTGLQDVCGCLWEVPWRQMSTASGWMGWFQQINDSMKVSWFTMDIYGDLMHNDSDNGTFLEHQVPLLWVPSSNWYFRCRKSTPNSCCGAMCPVHSSSTTCIIETCSIARHFRSCWRMRWNNQLTSKFQPDVSGDVWCFWCVQ